MLAASIGAAALIASLTVPAVRLLFERFQFTAEDTAATAAALFFFAFAITVWGALQVLTRAFYAQRRMWAPVGVGTATTVAAIPLYWALQRSFGLRGVAVASVLALGGYTIVLAVIWYRDPTHRNRLSGVADTAGRSLIPAVAGGFAAFITARLVAGVLGESGAATFIAVVLSVAAFAAAAAGAINLLASGGVLVVESADRGGAAEDGTSGGPGPPPQAGG